MTPEPPPASRPGDGAARSDLDAGSDPAAAVDGDGFGDALEWRRKLLHLATAVLAVVPAVVPDPLATSVLAALAGIAVAVESVRLRRRAWRERLDGWLPGIFRRDEARRISGATLLLVGYAAASALFGGGAAAAGILATAAGDAAAALGGQAYGRLRRRQPPGEEQATSGPYAGTGAEAPNKTLAGTAACAVVATVAVIPVTGAGLLALVAGTAAAVVERITPRRWDNVTLPLAVAAVVETGFRAGA